MQSSMPDHVDSTSLWKFSNVGHDFPESDSVSAKETTRYEVQASMEPFPCLSENIGFNTNLEMRQNMSTSSDTRRRISVKREWGAFLPLAMDKIRYSAAQAPRPAEDGFQSDNSSPRERNRCLSSSSEREYNDVYIPSGLTVNNQRTKNTLPTSASTPCKRTDKRTNGSAPSRNRQAADQVEDIRVKLSLCRVRRERLNDLVCPVAGCQYKQLNGRMPDFRRHIRTHIRKEAEIRCKGVPWQDFVRNRDLFPKISVDEQPYVVPEDDGLWVGGCLKTFSRADALKRHHRNTSCAALDHNKLH